MKSEDQVCTVEQSKKLFSLGVKGPSDFNYGVFVHKKTKEEKVGLLYGGIGGWQSLRSYKYESRYPAFSVTEFGVMIGKGTKAAENHWQWLIDCVNSGLSATVAYNPVALAGFVITQIEIGILKPREIHQRLSDDGFYVKKTTT